MVAGETTTPAHLSPTFRLVASRYPTVSVFDRIVDTRNFQALLELESLTNPRVREEAGDFRKTRPEDRVSGPGSTPIMASFAYSQPSRFCDGTYGVYYAALDEDTAVAEVRFHDELFYGASGEPPLDIDKRLYVATIDGTFNDIRGVSMRSKIYDPDIANYAYPQAHARKLYEANQVDGILYKSLRKRGGECVAAFRPRIVTDCKTAKYMQFRWDGQRIAAIADITNIRSYT